jgi:tetratricopeptide (TPR) repeat protein
MDYRDVERHYQHLTANPTDPDSFAVLRDFFAQQGQNAQLAELYEFRAGYLPNPREKADHLDEAARLWIEFEGNVDRARRDLEEVLRVDPLHEAAARRLEDMLRQAQDFAGLTQFVTQRIAVLEQQGENPETAGLRSRLYQNLGELKERVENDAKGAILCYKRAYAIDPTNTLALYLSREIYRRAGDVRSAAKLFELEIKAEGSAERRVVLLRELATLMADALEDLDGAVGALERAQQAVPADPDALYDLSNMLVRRAQSDKARPDDLTRAADCQVGLAAAAETGQSLEYLEYGLDLAPAHAPVVAAYVRVTTEAMEVDRARAKLKAWFDLLGADAALPVLSAAFGDVEGRRRFSEISGRVPPTAAAHAPAAVPDFVSVPEAPPAAGGDLDGLFGEMAEPPAPPAAAPEPEPQPEPAPAPSAAGDEAGAGAAEVDVERLREEAQKFRMAGKDPQVEALMERIVRAIPGDPEAVSYLERRYRAKGNFAGLHQMLLEAGMARDLAPNVRIMRLKEAAALAEGRLNDAEGAVAAWKRVLNIDPVNGDARRSLERLLRKLERWGDMVELMEQRVQLAEDEQEKLQLLTRIASLQESSLQDPSATLDTFWRIQALDEQNVKYLRKIEALAEQTERWPDVARALELMAEASQASAERLRFREKLLLVQQDRLQAPDDALLTVDAILTDNPEHIPTLKRQVDLLAATGSVAAAADALEAIIERLQDREKPPALRRLAEIARADLGDLARAADALARALELDPVNQEVRDELHKMYDDLGRPADIAESFEAWAKAVRDPAQKKELLRKAAQVLDQRVGDLEAACERYAQILKLGEDPEALEAFARLHETQQDWEALVGNTVRRAEIAAIPEDKARLLREAADLLDDRLGEPAKAAPYLERILADVAPDHVETLRRLVDVQIRAENFAAAAEALLRLRELTPDAEEQLKHSETLGEWYRGPLADPQKAIAIYEDVLKQWSVHAGSLLALSELYEQVGDSEKLLRVLRARSKAADLPNEQAALMLEGARVSEDLLKDAPRAWGWFQEALARDPDDPDLFAKVTEAGRRLAQWPSLAGLYESAATRTTAEDLRVEHLRAAARIWEEKAESPVHALEDLVEAIRNMPADDTLLDEADRIARLGGHWEVLGKAYDFLLRRADLAEDRVALLRRFATVVLEDGRRPEFALGPILRAMEEQPDDRELFETYERAARAAERFEDLLRVYDKQVRAAAEPAERWNLMLRAAEIYAVNLKNLQKGLQVVGIAVNQDPLDDGLAEQVIEALRRIAGQVPDDQKAQTWEWAVGHYRRLASQRHDPADPALLILHRRIADLQIRGTEDPAAGFETLRAAHLLAPTDTQLVEDLEALAREHRFLEPLAAHYAEALQRSMRVDVAKDLHRRRAALLEEDLERPDEASEHYWQLLQLDPDDDDARKRVARFYEKVGRWNDLVVILEEDLAKVLYDDEKVGLLLRIADIWESRIGNRFEAIDVLRKVARIQPDDEAIAARIKKLAAPRLGGDEADVAEASADAVPDDLLGDAATPGIDEPIDDPWAPKGPARAPARVDDPWAPAPAAEPPVEEAPAADPWAAPAPTPATELPADDAGTAPPREAPAGEEDLFLPAYDEHDDSAKLTQADLAWMAKQNAESGTTEAGAEAPAEDDTAEVPIEEVVLPGAMPGGEAPIEESGEVPIEEGSEVPIEESGASLDPFSIVPEEPGESSNLTGELDPDLIEEVPDVPPPRRK